MTFLIALSPILWLILSLGILKIKSHIACLAALALAFAAALGLFGARPLDAGTAALEGVALAVWPILLVIVAAIFTYNLTLHTGAMEIIKQLLTSVSSDRRVLALLIGWGFGAFMEGMAGFGTAVAIPVSMLVALGFPPLPAIALCLVANTVPTAYGSIGIPTVTLAQLTGFDASLLASYESLQLLLFNFLCPFLIVAIAGGGLSALRGVLPLAFLSGAALALPELLIASLVGPELAVMASSLVIMGGIVLYAKLFPVNDPAYRMEIAPARITAAEGFRASLPFLFILLFLLATSKLVPAIHGPLASVKTSVLIYSGAGGVPYTFTWLATPGVLIFLAAFLGGSLQGAKFPAMLRVLMKTAADLRFTMVTIIAVIATAKVMGASGMTSAIAETAVAAAGSFYPLLAPLVGSLGTFITGSATSSNVLFAALQTGAAAAIGADPSWLAASNGLGACIGKMISPQSIAIGTGAIGLAGKDSEILRRVVFCYLAYVVIAGLLVYFGPAVIGL